MTQSDYELVNLLTALTLGGGVLFVYALIFGGIGWIIGKDKGRGAAGFGFGLLLGPLGWLVAALLKENTGWMCPACKGAVPVGATRCMHCGIEFPNAAGVAPNR